MKEPVPVVITEWTVSGLIGHHGVVAPFPVVMDSEAVAAPATTQLLKMAANNARVITRNLQRVTMVNAQQGAAPEVRGLWVSTQIVYQCSGI